MAASTESQLLLPMGNTAELFQWPQRVATALGAEETCRLHSLLLGKIIVCSDYSGYGSEIEALSCSLCALMDKNAWQFEGDGPIIFRRVCDIGSNPQNVLKQLSRVRFQNSMCVFGDVVEHCHEQAVLYLRAATPGDDVSPSAAEAAHAEILQWLLKNRSWALAPSVKQECLVHRGTCPVSPMSTWMTNAKNMLSKKRKHAEAMLFAEPEPSQDDGADKKDASTARVNALARVLSPETDEECREKCLAALGRPLSMRSWCDL